MVGKRVIRDTRRRNHRKSSGETGCYQRMLGELSLVGQEGSDQPCILAAFINSLCSSFFSSPSPPEAPKGRRMRHEVDRQAEDEDDTVNLASFTYLFGLSSRCKKWARLTPSSLVSFVHREGRTVSRLACFHHYLLLGLKDPVSLGTPIGYDRWIWTFFSHSEDTHHLACNPPITRNLLPSFSLSLLPSTRRRQEPQALHDRRE